MRRMKIYRIYTDGEFTGRYYAADDAAEAIQCYIDECIAEYRADQGEDPDSDMIHQLGEITAV